jgi:hypothetical protein
MELIIAITIMVTTLYLKARCQRFFYYGRNPLKGHKSFVGYSTTEGR